MPVVSFAAGMSDVRDEPLNDRAQRLLRILVESYIRDGQPVGSRSLSRDSGLNLSSATIRNVMADLEELGFVASPHTSAGRVPTDKGYRFFVDTLLRVQPLDPDSVTEFRRQLDSGHDAKALVATASQLLSSVTQLAGVVTLPSAQQASITHIEFVPLSENRVLAVLVLNNSEVQNRIIQLERGFPARGAATGGELPQSAFRGALAQRGASGDPAADARNARDHEPDHARCHHHGAAGLQYRGCRRRREWTM